MPRALWPHRRPRPWEDPSFLLIPLLTTARLGQPDGHLREGPVPGLPLPALQLYFGF